MNRHARRRLVLVAACLLALSAPSCRDRDDSQAPPKSAESPFAVEHLPSGETVVVLSPAALAAAGIATAAPTARTAAIEVEAIGITAADPARLCVVRAPLSGALVAGPDAARPWAVMGSRVEAGAVLGAIAPRAAPLTQAERAYAQNRLAAARADELATQAELEAAVAALNRARTLNAAEQGVSDQVVEAAAAQVKVGEAKLAAARASAAVFAQLAEGPGTTTLGPLPLGSPRRGEVIAVLGQPGENVEAGTELFRVADFGELFVDVRLPAELATAVVQPEARVVVNGGDAAAPGLQAVVVGLAPTADVLAPMLRLRVADASGRLRPGLGATAWLSREGATRPGFAVPAAAVLRYASRNWVYVESEPGHFARREVVVARSDGDIVLVWSGVGEHDHVVSTGAMSLLSTEQIAAGGSEGGD
jgi:biotin carboxyl carrier protein